MKTASPLSQNVKLDAKDSLQRIKQILLEEFSKENQRLFKEMEGQFAENIDYLKQQQEEALASLKTRIESEMNIVRQENESRFKKQNGWIERLEKSIEHLRAETESMKDMQTRDKATMQQSVKSVGDQLATLKRTADSDSSQLISHFDRLEKQLKDQANLLSNEKSNILKVLNASSESLGQALELDRLSLSRSVNDLDIRLTAKIEALKKMISPNTV
jgi:hypothetical protein